MARGKVKPNPKRPAAAKPPAIITQQQVADALGLTARQVRNLLNAGMPATLPEASQWYTQFKLDEAKARGPKEKGKGKLREQELKNRLLELDVLEREGRSIREETVRQKLRALNLRYSGAIRTLLQYNADLLGIEAADEMQIALERIANRMLAIGRGDDPEELDLEDAPEVAA